MDDLAVYQFPSRPSPGVLFGLSVARLAALAASGVVFIVVSARPTPAMVAGGTAGIVVLVASAGVRVAGRAAIDWIPVWAAFGWSMATRNSEFYSSPDLTEAELPAGALDLPGELFGLEVHTFVCEAAASVSNPTPVGYGVVIDTYRSRLVAVAEVSGGDFLFLDPGDQQARVSGWGATLDHLAQSAPDICRIQLVHLTGPSSVETHARLHARNGGHGNNHTAASYRQVLAAAGHSAQEHRMLVAIALDSRVARRAIRQAGGGPDGKVKVLLDRAATVEDALRSVGIEVHGWLPARSIGEVLRVGFDPAARTGLDDRPADVNQGGGIDLQGAGPTGMVEQWSALRHDSGWSTTLQVIRPPARAVTGDFLQHLLIGVPCERRMSLLYVPTPMAAAERRAQTQQVAAESEQTLRARWGFGTSARHRRQHQDAASREEDLVEGRAVFRLVWMVTVTAPTPPQLDAAVGQIEAAGRRCGLELRRLAGTQRQAASFTLPVCRGAR